MNMKATGACIYRNREKLNISLEELSDKVGVGVSVLMEFEKGLKKPKASELRRISDVLDVPMIALMHGGGGMYREVIDKNGRSKLEYREY